MLLHLINTVPVAPLRSEPSHRSQMVSQLLFGEVCELLESKGDFVKIKALYDEYEGWCQIAQMNEIAYQKPDHVQLAGKWVNKIIINQTPAFIPFGSCLSFLQNDKAEIGSYKLEYNGSLLLPAVQKMTDESLREITGLFINTPYLWGGKSVFGIDCSGFTQTVFRCFNTYLHRDANMQATQGESIGFLQEVKCGDLAFFDNADGRIMHVGILLDSSSIIHASGKVRIDTIDSAGIINSDTGKRTHTLRILKRII